MQWKMCLIKSSQRPKECAQFHFTHTRYTRVYCTAPHNLSLSLSKRPRPPAWVAGAERISKVRRRYRNLIRSQIGSLPQPDLKRVGPWRVDRQAVLGLGEGRAASWSGNSVVLWADWLTDAWEEQKSKLPGWPLSGPHRAPAHWCTARSGPVRHKSTVKSNWVGVCSAQIEDKEASKQGRLCTVSWKRRGAEGFVDTVLKLPLKRWLSALWVNYCAIAADAAKLSLLTEENTNKTMA